MTLDNIMKFLYTTYTIGLPILMAYVVDALRKNKKKKSVSDEAMKLMLRIQLMSIHDACMSNGYASNEKYQTYMEIWELYHEGYGGNLLSERHKQDMENLEIKN